MTIRFCRLVEIVPVQHRERRLLLGSHCNGLFTSTGVRLPYLFA